MCPSCPCPARSRGSAASAFWRCWPACCCSTDGSQDQTMAARDVRVSADAEALHRDVAGAIAATVTRAVSTQGHCSLVLSGGSTPRPIHRLLASANRETVPWNSVDVFWGDERFVPAD